ncbi:MAG: class I SAM-dependent methyltransferase [Vicinamibacterales bacterium]|nr:class I SAM-dependent methyltransferase [Vicinamibacterales bacterium]
MWERVVRRLKRIAGVPPEPEPEPLREIAPTLVVSAPSPQNALDVFRGEWISSPPPGLEHLEAGQMPLFEDPRVAWGLDALGGVTGQRVLELGPMEGGHSYMLQQRGAREVVSIEGNQRCFLKCLVTKEVAGLDRVRYELGNFIEYMRATPERFDLVLASGVLYHMADPLEVVHLVSRVSDRAFFWTHYHADRVMQTASAPHFSGPHQLTHRGFTATGHRYEYNLDSRYAKYAGGLAGHAHWLSRDDLLRLLAHVGFTRVDIGFDDVEHVHGPCFALACSKR